MKRILWLLALALLCGVPARRSFAQVGHTALSAEWLAASADQVVRATVRALQVRDAPALHPFDKPGDWQWVTVTLAVGETLKGEAGNRLVFTVRRQREDETLSQWRASGQPLLWFLEKRGRAENNFVAPESAWAPVYGTGENHLAVELGGRERNGQLPAPIFSMNLTLIRTDARLVDVVRSSVRSGVHGALVEAYGLSVSRELMQQTGRSGDANAVMVPVNSQLERQALHWINATDTPSHRTEGVSALRYFRTPAHEKLLRDLLRDLETSTLVDYDRAGDGKLYHWRVYPIREAAARVLEAWGLPIADPPRRERLNEYMEQ